MPSLFRGIVDGVPKIDRFAVRRWKQDEPVIVVFAGLELCRKLNIGGDMPVDGENRFVAAVGLGGGGNLLPIVLGCPVQVELDAEAGAVAGHSLEREGDVGKIDFGANGQVVERQRINVLFAVGVACLSLLERPPASTACRESAWRSRVQTRLRSPRQPQNFAS